jgi:hypothetical protein
MPAVFATLCVVKLALQHRVFNSSDTRLTNWSITKEVYNMGMLTAGVLTTYPVPNTWEC